MRWPAIIRRCTFTLCWLFVAPFVGALVTRGVQFDLMTYPGAKHGISSRAGQRHVYGLIDAFFRKHLGQDGAGK